MLSGLVGATTSRSTPSSLAAFSAQIRQAFQKGFVTVLTKNATEYFLGWANAALDSTPVTAALARPIRRVAKLRRVIFMVSSSFGGVVWHGRHLPGCSVDTSADQL